MKTVMYKGGKQMIKKLLIATLATLAGIRRTQLFYGFGHMNYETMYVYFTRE